MMHKSQPANLALGLLVLLIAIAVSSCSKQTPPVANQPAATPEPKMEGQSANWKVTVEKVELVAKQEPDFMAPSQSRNQPENRFDTIQLAVNLEYKGTPMDVPRPSVVLVDSKEQRIAALQTSIVPTRNITADEADQNSAFQNEAVEIARWIDPELGGNASKTRALKTGDKLSFIFLFQDPKDYANLRFAFADVPPITLHVKRDDKQATPSPSPAPTNSPTPLNANAQGESKNWKVIVTSFKKYPNDTTDPSQPRDSVEVRLELVYIGAPRAVGPPTAHLIDGKGTKHAGDIRSTTVMRWIFPDGPPEVGLKPGDNLSATFSFKDPKDYANLTLVFMDVAPISLPTPQDPDPEN